jgi:hypothetical protein
MAKRHLSFMGVHLRTVAEGQITELHVGLKETMNALYLKNLAQKTRRGLRGRIEAGKSGGGNSYGYDVVKKIGDNGEPIRGERQINPQQAAIVKRVFSNYARGISPGRSPSSSTGKACPSPSGKGWGPSTIHGNWQRGIGTLNNEIYIGKQVWNRLRYIKDPQTGKRISRLNLQSKWIIGEVPELRIIDQDLWDQVKVPLRDARDTMRQRLAGAAEILARWDGRKFRCLPSIIRRRGPPRSCHWAGTAAAAGLDGRYQLGIPGGGRIQL